MIRRRVRRLRRLEDRAVDERHALERRVVAPVVVAEELIERALLRVGGLAARPGGARGEHRSSRREASRVGSDEDDERVSLKFSDE